MPKAESIQKKRTISDTLSQLRKVFALQEDLAKSKQELIAIELEWEHFKQDNHLDDDTYTVKSSVKAKRLLNLWIRYQAYAEDIPGRRAPD